MVFRSVMLGHDLGNSWRDIIHFVMEKNASD